MVGAADNKQIKNLNVLMFLSFLVTKLSNVQFSNNVDDNFFELLQFKSFKCYEPIISLLSGYTVLHIDYMKRVEDKAGIVEQISSLFFVLTEV